MGRLLGVSLLLCCLHGAFFTEPGCVINLECEECLPDNMPLVTSHRAANGTIVVGEGDEVELSCGGGGFLLLPGGRVRARCQRGRYRARGDGGGGGEGSARPLRELGCQEGVFEDGLHAVRGCAPPLQGRAYRQGADHLAAVCYDPDLALPVRATLTSGAPSALPPHDDRAAPLSLLGNFNHMFDARTRHDAERLFGDEARLQRRLRELLRPYHVTLAGHSLAAAPLLAPHYFHDQNMRVADFASNKVLAWRSVAEGNLRHLQQDVSRLLRRARPAPALAVHAGTHGVAALRTDSQPLPLMAKPGRFPVPRYLWTAVLDPASRRGLALVVLNEPLVAVSEVRDSVFCDSRCGHTAWARELRRHRRYETPALGLAFCCDVHSLAAVVPELPRDLIADIPHGDKGMLLDDYDHNTL